MAQQTNKELAEQIVKNSQVKNTTFTGWFIGVFGGNEKANNQAKAIANELDHKKKLSMTAALIDAQCVLMKKQWERERSILEQKLASI